MVCIRRVLLVTMHLALFSLGWQAPEYSAFWPVWTGRTVAVACTKLVFLVLHLAAVLPEAVYFSSAPCIWKSLVRAFA